MMIATMLFLTLALGQELPAGNARAIVASRCGACHGLDVVMAAGGSKARWQAVVEEMVTDGAQLSKAEIPLVVGYLAKNFPAASVQPASKSTAKPAPAAKNSVPK